MSSSCSKPSHYPISVLLSLTLVTYTAFDLMSCSDLPVTATTTTSGSEGNGTRDNTTLDPARVFHVDRKFAIENIINSHDAEVPPNFEQDIPTDVVVQLFIVSFDSISESTMDYSITVFLRQTWLDKRLSYTKLEGVEKLELDSRIMSKIWVPDLYFVNEKRASFHDVTVPNKLMHIFPDGRVLYSARVSMTLSCDMNLVKFPFDSQVCHVGMESYGYSTKNIVFHWHESPVLKRDNLNLPQFEFEDTKCVDCTKSYAGTGQYTCIRAEFHLTRTYGYYLAQVYVPSIMIVILSWVSFWLDVEAVPARISLGLLTVLTMTTQSANARAHLPRVSYIKAIDVWMAMCLFFVFAALIEFAYVNVNARVEKRRHTSGQMNQSHGGLRLGIGLAGKQQNDNGATTGDSEEEPKPKRLFSKITRGEAKARHLDKISRIVFPSVFVAFNLFYWIFYMTWELDHSISSGP